MKRSLSHEDAVESLYQQLTLFVRRSRDLGNDIHPELSLVSYTVLSVVAATSDTRAADLAAVLGLDKSTVSRHLDALVQARLLRRGGEQPGRRGYTLSLTRQGRHHLEVAASRVRSRLADWLADWDESEIDHFTNLFIRFNDSIA
jgi:DNA-binding MarR family transcriptional regulator